MYKLVCASSPTPHGFLSITPSNPRSNSDNESSDWTIRSTCDPSKDSTSNDNSYDERTDTGSSSQVSAFNVLVSDPAPITNSHLVQHSDFPLLAAAKNDEWDAPYGAGHVKLSGVVAPLQMFGENVTSKPGKPVDIDGLLHIQLTLAGRSGDYVPFDAPDLRPTKLTGGGIQVTLKGDDDNRLYLGVGVRTARCDAKQDVHNTEILLLPAFSSDSDGLKLDGMLWRTISSGGLMAPKDSVRISEERLRSLLVSFYKSVTESAQELGYTKKNGRWHYPPPNAIVENTAAASTSITTRFSPRTRPVRSQPPKPQVLEQKRRNFRKKVEPTKKPKLVPKRTASGNGNQASPKNRRKKRTLPKAQRKNIPDFPVSSAKDLDCGSSESRGQLSPLGFQVQQPSAQPIQMNRPCTGQLPLMWTHPTDNQCYQLPTPVCRQQWNAHIQPQQTSMTNAVAEYHMAHATAQMFAAAAAADAAAARRYW